MKSNDQLVSFRLHRSKALAVKKQYFRIRRHNRIFKIPDMKSKSEQTSSIQRDFKHLADTRFYTQAEVVGKLGALDIQISRASFSKLITGQPVGDKLTRDTCRGLDKLVELELGQVYNPVTDNFDKLSDHSSQEEIIISPIKDLNRPAYRFYEQGRLPIANKVSFFNDAQKELIEVGVRLATFTNYFHSRSSHEFSDHIEALLKKGVTIKLYLLDPDGNEARIYFQDRAKAIPEERESIEKIRRVKEKLILIRNEFDAKKLPGKIELYAYKHIPTNYFLCVDGGTRHGKLISSSYLYGLRRAEVPLLEIEKRYNPALYRKYYSSMRALIKDARLID